MITTFSEKVLGRSMLILAVMFTILPILSMFSASLEPADSTPLGLSWPSDPQWGNYATAFSGGNVFTLMKSSLFIVVLVLPTTILFATLAGYAIGKMKIRMSQRALGGLPATRRGWWVCGLCDRLDR